MTVKTSGPLRPIVFNGRQIGHVQGSNAVFKVRHSRHHYHIWDSWTLDARVLAAVRPLIERIVFDDIESGQTWAASLEAFRIHGRRTENRTGVKIALAARHWHKIGEQEPPGQGQLFEGATA